jgi:hypothetical protein
MGRKFIPRIEIKTIPSMLIIVTPPNTLVTSIRPGRLLFAAGYINMGINGSQGPKTKIVKRTQGVIFIEPSLP